MSMPWLVGADGYTTRVNGQLLWLDSTTSMSYQNLVECEKARFDCRLRYPRRVDLE